MTVCACTLSCLAQPLFPQGCTVILAAGLPGDAESENAYRQQLQDWVDLAASSGRVDQILAFCDAPEVIKVSSGVRCTISKNDRKSFLEAVKALSERTNTTVVVAWGHGGRQGSNPVLHVRGPRLTVGDFAQIAAKTSESQWILLFRGSGAFARQIAGPRARVISSDVDQSFTSDPVGMPVMVKLARTPAAQSFERLAGEFGRATASWYEERSLARTEEPALWTGETEPQLLAAATRLQSAEQTGSADRVDNTRPEEPPSPDTQASPAKEGVRRTELGEAWKSIKKVDASQYPEHDAVVLNQRLICRLGTDPALVTEQEQFIQVLTPEGKSIGDIDVSFAPPAEEIEFHECEVLRPNGEVVQLETDRIGEAREQPLGDYMGQRRKFFSLPGVVPGAIIHVRYTTQWKKFPLPQISMALPLAKELPSLRSTVEVSLPRQMPFHWVFERLSAPDPVIKSTAYTTSYTWQFAEVAAQKKEALSPPGSEPRLLISTFQDWAAFGDWYGRISRLTAEATPEIETKTKELTANAKTDRDKLLALYNYVTALRYVAVPLGINSVRPHSAGNVLQNGFGDCKDKANLLNAMLSVLKIDAHLVLVPRFSQAHEAVPGLAFNHAISRVTLGSDVLWLDTTDDVCRFGMLPPGDYGRKVLVVDGKSKSLTELPAPSSRDHRLQIDGRLQWNQVSSSVPLTLKAVAFGYPDYELRTTLRESRENHLSLPLLATKLRPGAGNFALEKQESTPVASLDRDFTWKARGACIGLTSTRGNATALRAPFWLPKEWDVALHQRETPLFLNQGYPLVLEENFEIQLTGRARTMELPVACENSEGPLRWRMKWGKISDDKMEAHFAAELQAGELSLQESGAFQTQMRSLIAAMAGEATITLEKGNE